MRAFTLLANVYSGIQLTDDYEVRLGESFLHDPAVHVNVDDECERIRPRYIDHVDFVDGHLIPEREYSSDVILLVRDQTPDYGFWRLHHYNDPFCGEKHGAPCLRCQAKNKKYGCQCQCHYCKNRLNIRAKRVAKYPVDVLAYGHTSPYKGRKYHRRGLEALIKIPVNSGVRVEKFTRAWAENKNVSLFNHPNGYLEMLSYVNYKGSAEQPVKHYL